MRNVNQLNHPKWKTQHWNGYLDTKINNTQKMNKLIVLTPVMLICIAGYSQGIYSPSEPLAHTYSIVARDPDTGEMAVAVQSHWFSVGSIVIWGRSGVGVVATQSFVNPAYGPEGLQLMADGLTADVALSRLVQADEGKAVRQVAFLSNNGTIAAHTGTMCIDYAKHIVGENYSVQANMMLTDAVPAAMAQAFEANAGLPLAERVVVALAAAQNAGGDIRGRQSAALIVVSDDDDVKPWEDRLIDLRVEDHPEPVQELTRLLKLHRAYGHMNSGDLAVEHGDMELAMKEYAAAQTMFPEHVEMKFWTAVTLANNGDIEAATTILGKIYAGEDGNNWRELLRRLPKVGLVKVEDGEFKRLVEGK